MNKNNLDICEISPVLDLFSKKGVTLILREIYNGNNHFGKIKKALPNISGRTLANRLKLLENHKIIQKIVYPVIPPSVEYLLTNKGKDSQIIFDTMLNWKNKW